MVERKTKSKTGRTKRTIKTKKVVRKTKQPQMKRLYRSGNEHILGGVCGGVAEYFDIDPTVVRLIWAFSSFLWGIGIISYMIAWVIVPKNPKHKWG